MTHEEQKELESRMSKRMSSLHSPANINTPKSNRTMSLNPSGSLEKLQTVAQVIQGGGPPSSKSQSKTGRDTRDKQDTNLMRIE